MIVLRHCQSEFNRLFTETRKDPGIPDPPLSTTGKQQAEALIPQLVGQKIRRIIVSPYRRALQTAMPIARALGVTPLINPLIRERAAFSCDIGSPRARLAVQWPELDFSALDETWWVSGLEASEVVNERAALFLEEMIAGDNWQETLVVSHWAFLLALTHTSLENGTWMRIDPRDPRTRL